MGRRWSRGRRGCSAAWRGKDGRSERLRHPRHSLIVALVPVLVAETKQASKEQVVSHGRPVYKAKRA